MHRFKTIYFAIYPHIIIFGTNKFSKPKIVCHTRLCKSDQAQKKGCKYKTVIPRERTEGILGKVQHNRIDHSLSSQSRHKR